MNCIKCNRALPDDSQFCQYCGERQGAEKQSLTASVKTEIFFSTENQQNDDTVSALLKQGFLALEDGKWRKAGSLFKQVLVVDVECAEAYLGQLMVEMHIHTRKGLLFSQQPFNDNINYKRAVRFASSPLREELEDLPMARLYTISTYCLEHGKSMESAIKTLEEIRGYRDAQSLIEKYSANLKEYKRKKKRSFWIWFSILFVLLFALFLTMYYFLWMVPEQKYEQAMGYLENQNYEEAYALFSELNWYRDGEEQKQNVKEIIEIQQVASAKVGDTIIYGSYEQDNKSYNGTEDIEWIVLEKKKDRILVVSKYVLYGRSFDSSYRVTWQRLNDMDDEVGDGTWKNSYVRYWLHTSFMSDAFSERLCKRILPITNKTGGEGSTKDTIFLLSETEAKKYFKTKKLRKTDGTEWAHYGSFTELTDYGVGVEWWLRTSGDTDDLKLYVNHNGTICDDSEKYTRKEYDIFGKERATIKDDNRQEEKGVRPAMWISISEVN